MSSSLAVGLKKGYPVTKIDAKKRPSQAKGESGGSAGRLGFAACAVLAGCPAGRVVRCRARLAVEAQLWVSPLGAFSPRSGFHSLTFSLPSPSFALPPRPLSAARLSKRTRQVRDLVGEVVGLAPYEKRLLDMLKTGGASSEKRMYKYAKRRLGTHKRALKKRDQVKEQLSKIRARG